MVRPIENERARLNSAQLRTESTPQRIRFQRLSTAVSLRRISIVALMAENAEPSEETLNKPLQENERTTEEEKRQDLSSLLLPNPKDLPQTPPAAVETNFSRYFVADFMKPGHDQYIYRHANGLCVIGLAWAHVALTETGGVTVVDFNVGKSDRSELKVTGKRKRNALQFESNSALCKVSANGNCYIVRCCVKGSLLEVNDRLIKQPDLLNSSADREGYVAIIMPKQGEWLKIKDSFLSYEEYVKLRGLS